MSKYSYKLLKAEPSFVEFELLKDGEPQGVRALPTEMKDRLEEIFNTVNQIIASPRTSKPIVYCFRHREDYATPCMYSHTVLYADIDPKLFQRLYDLLGEDISNFFSTIWSIIEKEIGTPEEKVINLMAE